MVVVASSQPALAEVGFVGTKFTFQGRNPVLAILQGRGGGVLADCHPGASRVDEADSFVR